MIPGLSRTYMEDSHVIAIEAHSDELQIFLDLLLEPGRQEYCSAKPGEQHCYRKVKQPSRRPRQLRRVLP